MKWANANGDFQIKDRHLIKRPYLLGILIFCFGASSCSLKDRTGDNEAQKPRERTTAEAIARLIELELSPFERAIMGIGPPIGVEQGGEGTPATLPAAIVADFEQSGDDVLGLADRVAPMADEWRAAAKSLGEDVAVDAARCGLAGCTVVTRHNSPDDLATTLAAFEQSPAFFAWNAAKVRSAPTPSADGGYDVTWLLFAPTDDETIEPDNRLFELEPRPIGAPEPEAYDKLGGEATE